MTTRKRAADWDRIEIEYLAGEVSIREIADRYGISDTAIRKRAKAHGLVRPVRRREPANQGTKSHATARVEAAAPAEVPGIAERGRELVARMLDELDATTSHIGEIEEAIELECAKDRTDRRRSAMLKAVSVKTRADTLKTLSLAFKTLSESGSPLGKRAATQERADQIANRLRPIGPPTLKAVK